MIVTEWDMFRALDFDRLRGIMAAPVLVDLRNIYSREDVARPASPIPAWAAPAKRFKPRSRAVSLRPEFKIGNRWGGAVRPPRSLRYSVLPSN